MKSSNFYSRLKCIYLLIGTLISFSLLAEVPEFDNDKPYISFTTQYSQLFNVWDGTTFNNQWNTIDAFEANDVASGYLQFVWPVKRVMYSKSVYTSPYTLTADIDYASGSNRAGVVIRINTATSNPDNIQAPPADLGFNREGIAFYPTDDGQSMIVQFSGLENGASTVMNRIQVPKPLGVTSLKGRGTLKIEDHDSSIYVYYNGSPFIRINLGGKTGSIYTSGTVYDANMVVKGTFSGMEIEEIGRVAVAQRDATLRLYSLNISYVWDDRPSEIFNTQYNQVYNIWDGLSFYNQWATIDSNAFSAGDVVSGYLQFVWSGKRVMYSKTIYSGPYTLTTDIDYSAGSNRGGVVIRINTTNTDNIQEPPVDPGFNREGIAFYPTDDGQSMIVQFSGIENGSSTAINKIMVPKPSGIMSLKNRGVLKIEDYGNSIYVFYNGSPYIHIVLGGKTGNIYTSGTVYDANKAIKGTFTGMEVEENGKIAIAQRDASLRLYSCMVQVAESLFDEDKPVADYTSQYSQVFNSWDGTTFYNQWNAVTENVFGATDIASGYLQFAWINKRIIYSKNEYSLPYVLQTELHYGDGSNRGGVVVRAIVGNSIDHVQEPPADPGFNREGIAFYPTDDGQAMNVQFSGVENGVSTLITRIAVAKPQSVSDLRDKGSLRIEDFGEKLYVYYNNLPFIRIELGGKTGSIYTSGTVYNANMEVMGTFSGMEVESIGRVALAQRDATLKLYSVTLQYREPQQQTINFPPIGEKLITDNPFTLNVTASSGLPVSYTLLSGPATLSGNTVTLTGEPGVVVISANQSGDLNYYPAAQVLRPFYVKDPASLNVLPTSQDYVDTWVATDALDRTLPSYEVAGAKRTNKLVGVFYYIWHGAHGDKVYDITKIINQYPSNPLSASNPYWGGVTAFHFWGEPEYGYFRSEDPWVIRHDLQMLSNAHVDFIYLDVTNGITYLETVKALCETSMQMRAEGIYTPQIVFTTVSSSGRVMNQLYDEFYSNQLFSDLWFQWNGKPLILGNFNDSELRQDVKDFFTIKYSWAWSNTTVEPNHWQWLDTYPQDYGWSVNSSTPEQIPVAVASHPTLTKGTSYHDGAQPAVNDRYLTDFTGQGLHSAEQWRRALEVNPPVIMVSQWNEWVAQRFLREEGSGIFAGRSTNTGDTYFVDVFTEEFNRDMAPMKGGHSDNYYYQLVSNIRKYKGMVAPQQFSGSKTINITGDFSQWQDVIPIFKDPYGDVMHRNFKSYDPTIIYTNTTGRNDIVESRVTYDTDNLYFYVKTVDNITSFTDPNWMLLFIDMDKCKTTGWEGYDYVVNFGVTSSTQTTLKQWNGSGWTNPVPIPYIASGNQMAVSIPRITIGLNTEFYFHWADNPQQLNNITGFFTDGESAPDRRFNYHFKGREGVVNGSFESPITTSFQYRPVADTWVFNELSGVQHNGSAWGAINAQEGVQTAFVQRASSIVQSVNFNAGRYKISFYAAQRNGNPGPQTLKVYYDSTLITTIVPASSSVWTYYTTDAFTSTNGVHTIKFIGIMTDDRTVFLDDVKVICQSNLMNAGFETPLTSNFLMGPVVDGWTFDGLSGVQRNGSAFGAPIAPNGLQTAVLQGAGSFYQDVDFVAGSYSLSFYAAYRYSNSQTQSINVYCDNVLIGNIIPTSSSSFRRYYTNRFTVTTGVHRIKFTGVLASDNSTFVDDVNIVLGGYYVPELTTKVENQNLEISICPNPASDRIIISNVEMNSQVSIYTLEGEKVFSMLKKDNEPLSIPVDNWYRGIYLIHIESDNRLFVRKMCLN